MLLAKPPLRWSLPPGNRHLVFRAYRPGMDVTPTHLRNHLRPILAALETRLGTLNELTQTTPIAVLAQTLGYSPQTLEAHAPERPQQPTRGTSPLGSTDVSVGSCVRFVTGLSAQCAAMSAAQFVHLQHGQKLFSASLQLTHRGRLPLWLPRTRSQADAGGDRQGVVQ